MVKALHCISELLLAYNNTGKMKSVTGLCISQQSLERDDKTCRKAAMPPDDDISTPKTLSKSKPSTNRLQRPKENIKRGGRNKIPRDQDFRPLSSQKGDLRWM